MHEGIISASVHVLMTGREKRWKQLIDKQASINPKPFLWPEEKDNCSFGTTWEKVVLKAPRCGRNFSIPITLFWSQNLCSDGVAGKCFQMSRFRCIQSSTFTFFKYSKSWSQVIPDLLEDWRWNNLISRSHSRGLYNGFWIVANFVPFFPDFCTNS